MKRLGLALLCLAIGAVTASAQDKYPAKPVKIIVPYAPGGATDIVARIVGDQLRQITAQSFVVENKPGANGIVAINEMLSAKPDGYTLMLGNVTTNAITPVLTPAKVPNYDSKVVPVTVINDIPEFLLVTTTNFTVKSVPELIDYAKKNPGKLRYGTVGAGSYPHYDMAFFAKKAGDLDMIAIHNKNGASGVINDMITGDTQASFLNVASSTVHINSGKLRPLALVNHLFRLGHSTPLHGLLTLDEMARAFDTAHLGRAPSRFDEQQLGVWQKDAVHRLSADAARTWLAPVLPAGLDAHATDAFIAALLPNVVLPEDARPWVDIVFGAPPPLGPAAQEVVREAGSGYFSAAAAAAARSGNDLPAIADAVRAATGRKGAALYMPLRVALTGRAHGPELAPLLKAMPAGKARERLVRFA